MFYQHITNVLIAIINLDKKYKYQFVSKITRPKEFAKK